MDPDIFAYLYPCRGEGYDGASYAISMLENESRFLAAPASNRSETTDIASRHDRGGTVLPEERGILGKTNALVCRLSDLHRTGDGLIMGCAPSADILTQQWPGISRIHLTLTFDDDGWPVARDLGSSAGTIVTYDGEKGERRSNFSWQLRGPEILGNTPLVLNLTDLVQFQLVIPPHDVTSEDYRRRVAEFRKRTAEPEDLIASLRVFSGASTRLSTGTHTPLTRSSPVLYKKEIGRGQFGVVTYVWNVTTREKYVVKEPTGKRLKTLELNSWKKEARIMRRISHHHVVAFLGAEFSPRPRLRFEFVPGGSLDKQMDISTFESKQILCQLSSGLAYLHAQEPQIAHRDIKPENILIVSREPDGLFVKFADFGLSGAKEILKTCCSTLLWAAPEIYLKIPDPVAAADGIYSVAVDIWSLGLVVASLECGLPDYEEAWRKDTAAWIRAVLRYVSDYEQDYRAHDSNLLYFLLDTMLVKDPDERSSASYCHEAALELSNCDSRVPFLQRIADGDGSSTPRASASLGVVPSVEEDGSEGTNGSEASTICLGPQSDSLDSSASRRKVGSSISLDPIADVGYRGNRFIDSLVNSTDSNPIASGVLEQGAQKASSGSSAPETHPRESMVNKSSSDPQGEDTDEAQRNDQQFSEEHGISFLARHHPPGEDTRGDDLEGTVVTVETVEASGLEAELRQSGRKRTWPDDVSPSLSLDSRFRSFTHPLSGVAVPRQCGDEVKGPRDQKRSKVYGVDE